MTNSPEFPDSSVVKECLTTDLVMRLRSENSMPPYYGVPKLQFEAAAEIERLRAALEAIKALPGEINPSNYDYADVVALNDAFIEAFQIARAALAQGGKDD